MIDTVKVVSIMEELYGVPKEDASSCLLIAVNACKEIDKRIRDMKNENDCRILTCAAALAFYRYTLRKVMTSDASTGFKAGDVTSSQSPSLMLETAENIRDDAFYVASPFLLDIDFMFEVM